MEEMIKMDSFQLLIIMGFVLTSCMGGVICLGFYQINKVFELQNKYKSREEKYGKTRKSDY
jgi:hypothetical protein